MGVYLINRGRLEVPFEKADGPVIAYPVLAGCRVLWYRNEDLQMLIKELMAELFTIRYQLFQFQKNQAIECNSNKSGILSRVMLQGALHFSIENKENIHQQEGTVFMTWSEAAHCKALFEGGKDYQALDIFFSRRMVEQLSVYYPRLKPELLEDFTKRKTRQPLFMTAAVKKVVTEIMDCNYDESTSRFYFDLKVREYLYVLMEGWGHEVVSRYRFAPFEKELVYRAREVLLKDLRKPPLTVRELAREVGLNEFRLKSGFKFFFDMGIFESFQRARMEMARAMLIGTNKPIKEIAGLAGYPRTTNFITAFRKFYGETPGGVRRGRE